MTEFLSATPEPVGPVRARPSGVWFVVGGLLLVAGIVAGIVLVVRIFDAGFLGVEAEVPGDGVAHTVTVDTDGDRFLWEQEYGFRDQQYGAGCDVVDAGTGRSVTLAPVVGDFFREADGPGWQAEATFDPGSGQLSVTCSRDHGPAQIGPALDVRDFVVSIVVAVVVPLLLIGLGLAVLIGTGVLWATRPRRTA